MHDQGVKQAKRIHIRDGMFARYSCCRCELKLTLKDVVSTFFHVADLTVRFLLKKV